MARRRDPFLELSEELIFYETPELRARRARLRRVVVAALSASVALFLFGLLARYSAKKAESVLNASSLPRTATLSALLPRASAALSVSVSLPVPVASLAALVPPAGTVITDDSSALTRAARALLAAGHTREGVAAARVALDANPGDAEPYVLLATGLQDLGNWPEARAVFTACEQKTPRTSNATCRYFARR
jgi:hypothetical protein